MAVLPGVPLLASIAAFGLVDRQYSLSYVAPDGYTGYLITRWACPGGETLPLLSPGGGTQEVTIAITADGTASTADPIPANGVQIAGFRYASGEAAPVTACGSRAIQRGPVGQQMSFVFTMASLGLGNGGILGDECSWEAFDAAHVGVPEWDAACVCNSIYVLTDPAVPLTPGTPAGL